MAYRTSSTVTDDRVRAARSACAERDRLLGLRDGFAAAVREAARRVHALRLQRDAEVADVERYTGGVWAFLYDLCADRAARLSREQAEARAILLRLEDESIEHDRLTAELAAIEGRLIAFAGADAELATARGAKLAELRAAGGELGEQLEEIAREAVMVLAARRATDEALVAGATARARIVRIMQLLDEARGWGALDMVIDSSLVSGVKRDKLDEARGAAGALQGELAVFRIELGELGVRFDAQLIELADTGRFLDVWFDNLFSDAAVQDRIIRAQASAASLRHQVEGWIGSLHAHAQALGRRAAELAAAEHNLTEPA